MGLSSLLSGGSRLPPQQNNFGGQPNVFSIHKSKIEKKATDIVPYGPPPTNAHPWYHAKISSSKRPNIRLYKGQQEIFTSSDHTFSSKIDLVLNGQAITMSQSTLSGHCTVHHPRLGDLKWKVPQLIGSSAELIDARGTRIAGLRSNKEKGMGKKVLELYVPCDPVFLDLVMGSALALMKAVKELAEGAMEVGAAGAEAAVAAVSG